MLDGARALCVVGGAEIYRLCLAYANRAVVTQVHGQVEGDTYFDLSLLSGWREVSRQRVEAAGRNSHDFSVVELEKSESIG
jgi:dihydrofolate reductase